ncbi:MAG: hypothetical protein M3162_09665 [Thermoproteota archaeon]|nr:hypothetical protein [Thermoproteota archaeon]
MSITHPYRCSICSKITSRKENALRHNTNKHSGQGMVYDSANKLVYAPSSTLSSDSTKQKESMLFGIKDSKEESNHHGTNKHHQESFVKKNKSLTLEDDNETYYKDAGEWGLCIDEMEAMLASQPQDIKDVIPSMMLRCAIMSMDPLESFKGSLALFKDIDHSNKLVEFVSKNLNIPLLHAKELVKSSILRKYKDNR